MRIPGRKNILLKNGIIVDGTGKTPCQGSLLVKDGLIEGVGCSDFDEDEKEVIDCSGKIISPGFIDSHSHMDWFMTHPDAAYSSPFAGQGITTFVGGNCGYGIAGFREQTPYKKFMPHSFFNIGHENEFWHTFADYFDQLDRNGITHNITNFAGHGTTRTSISGFKPGPLNKQETGEMLYLLEKAMDEGACGVSLGLAYQPGIFADLNELTKIAQLVKKKDKMLSVHGRAYTTLSGSYPMRPFGKAHNLLAIEEMLNVALRTGVRMQYSHLVFIGEKSWQTFETALSLFDRAISRGVDVKTDCFALSCGVSQINAVFPEWFQARLPQAYDNRLYLMRLKFEIGMLIKGIGFGYDDIQIAFGNHEKINPYNGRTILEIARMTKSDPFETLIDIAKTSRGSTRIIGHRYMNDKITEGLLKYDHTLYMTDAWYEPKGLQNPSLSGGFPRILQTIREKKLLRIEEAVHKMTGAAADHFQIKNRGRLLRNLAADITVFDPGRICDNTTMHETSKAPDGIEHVFINGLQTVSRGKILDGVKAGAVLRA